MTPAMQQLLSTPTPALSDCVDSDSPVDGAPRLDDALFLKRWLLDLELRVKAGEVAKHRLLKDQIHAYVKDAFGQQLDSMISVAADRLYERCCEIPDEFEADTPDNLPLDLPPVEPD